jgi:diguanylate cyclase (GGDEF)-like protein
MAAAEGQDRVRLGWALHERADDVAAGVIERSRTFPADSWPSDDAAVLDAIAETDRLAVRVVGRWLATGARVTEDETRQLAALGLLAETVPLSCLVKLYLAWRDVTLEVVEEEGRRLGVARETVDEVREVVARSNDAAIVWMTRQFDEERRRLQEALAHQALHDGLTGLANRTLLFDRLEKELQSARRYGGRLALLFVDLDDFKAVNDTRGHDAGDEVLVEVARRLQAVVRPSDTVARLGGDEFVILCERLEGAADEAVAIADRAREVLEEISLSASVGIAIATGAEDADTLVNRADDAMYAAKRRGGADHTVYAAISAG